MLLLGKLSNKDSPKLNFFLPCNEPHTSRSVTMPALGGKNAVVSLTTFSTRIQMSISTVTNPMLNDTIFTVKSVSLAVLWYRISLHF